MAEVQAEGQRGRETTIAEGQRGRETTEAAKEAVMGQVAVATQQAKEAAEKADASLAALRKTQDDNAAWRRQALRDEMERKRDEMERLAAAAAVADREEEERKRDHAEKDDRRRKKDADSAKLAAHVEEAKLAAEDAKSASERNAENGATAAYDARRGADAAEKALAGVERVEEGVGRVEALLAGTLQKLATDLPNMMTQALGKELPGAIAEASLNTSCLSGDMPPPEPAPPSRCGTRPRSGSSASSTSATSTASSASATSKASKASKASSASASSAASTSAASVASGTRRGTAARGASKPPQPAAATACGAGKQPAVVLSSSLRTLIAIMMPITESFKTEKDKLEEEHLKWEERVRSVGQPLLDAIREEGASNENVQNVLVQLAPGFNNMLTRKEPQCRGAALQTLVAFAEEYGTPMRLLIIQVLPNVLALTHAHNAPLLIPAASMTAEVLIKIASGKSALKIVVETSRSPHDTYAATPPRSSPNPAKHPCHSLLSHAREDSPS